MCPIIAPPPKASSAFLSVGDWELWGCLLSREQPRCGYFLSIVSMNLHVYMEQTVEELLRNYIAPITICILSDFHGATLFGNNSNQIQYKCLWCWQYIFYCRKETNKQNTLLFKLYLIVRRLYKNASTHNFLTVLYHRVITL